LIQVYIDCTLSEYAFMQQHVAIMHTYNIKYRTNRQVARLKRVCNL